MSVKLSGSSLPIATECQWWLRGDVSYVPVETFLDPEEETGLGACVHELATIPRSEYTERLFSAICLKHGADESDALPYYKQLDAKLSDFDGVELYREMALAYDPVTKTARVLGFKIDRKYEEHGLKPGEIPCSMDLVISGTEVVVVDYKTGQQQYVTKIQRNAQMMFGALCVSKALGVTVSRIELWFVSPHRVWVESAIVDPWMLPSMEDRLHEMLAKLVNESPGAKPGDHCQFCPALGGCPATAKNLGMLAPGEFEWTTDIKSVEHAAFMAQGISNLDKSVENIRAALKQYSDSCGGIPLDNGQVWKATEGSKTSFNATAAKVKLIELGCKIEDFQQTSSFKSYRATGKRS